MGKNDSNILNLSHQSRRGHILKEGLNFAQYDENWNKVSSNLFALFLLIRKAQSNMSIQRLQLIQKKTENQIQAQKKQVCLAYYLLIDIFLSCTTSCIPSL